MVYKFDPDGHGKIIAEARDPRLESLLGHHYPASDIPQRARELYLRNRVRVLVDVHYEPSPLVPRQLPGGRASELDMSLCHLRSMSPLHLQYLKNMGVTATLVVSLVREGKLWGLIACHHYAPRNLRFAVRAAADLLAEVVSTRIAAIENYAHAQVAIQVRRLEQRLVEATSTEGDWRLALFRNPRTLLQPLDATGAALFHDGEVLTAGEVPSTPELRALLQWIEQQRGDGPFSCSSVGAANPALDSLTPTASGVLAVQAVGDAARLPDVVPQGTAAQRHLGRRPVQADHRQRPAGAVAAPLVRRLVGDRARHRPALVAAASWRWPRAFGAALVDIIVQINAVRLLIAEHQLTQMRATRGQLERAGGRSPTRSGRALFANDAFAQLTGRDADELRALGDLAALFTAADAARQMLDALRARAPALARRAGAGAARRLARCRWRVRAEVVPARDGSVLGFFLIFDDLTDIQRAREARAPPRSSRCRRRRQDARAQARAGASPTT